METQKMGLHYIKLLTKLLLALYFSPSTGFFSSNQLFIGTVEPMDPDVCETQNITFTSTLLETPTVNYSIGFTIKNRSTNGTYVAVENDRIEIINETISQFTVSILEVADVSKSENLHVNSYYWQDFGNDIDKLKLGQTSTARVFPLPEQVKDFECIVHNYESMVCTWNYGKNYGENMPDVIFQWRLTALPASWTNCKSLDIVRGTCTWDNPTDDFFKERNLTMRLILDQKCGVNVSTEFNIDTTKIVKPSPVLGISTTVNSSRCIQLSWDTSYLKLFPDNFHRIVVSCKYDNFAIIFNTQDLKHKKNVCNLHPYTEYTFKVSIKPSGKYSGYWSDSVEDVAKTFSEIPSASPQLIDGVYTSNHLKCQGTDSKRRVCVYWKPIRKEQENGPMRGIQSSFTALSDKTKQTQENWAEDTTYGCSVLMCNLSYDVIIQARNVNGTSEAGHFLNIPKYSSVILPPQFIVEWDNTSNVYISWERRGHTFIKGYTVAWCRNKNGKCELTQEVGWKRLLSNTSEAVLQINASAHDFLYGISASTETGSTWVTWQDCVYQRNAVPTRKPQNVGVSTGSQDNTLLITWDKLTCQTDEPYIWLYTVRYWKINGGSQKSVNVSASGEAIIVLNNLEKDQSYSVTVRGVTKEGHEGPESRPQTGVPVSKRLKPSEIAGIIIGVIVCVLLAGVGIFCVIRRCKEKANRVLEQAGKITIPAQPDEYLLNVNRKNIDDGGCANKPFLEDQTHATGTEQEVGHNANGYISTETVTLNLSLSHRMSDLHDTKMLSDPALKLELKNESHLVENEQVLLAETIFVLQNQNREENATAHSSINDRNTDYVKGNKAFFDSDTDNNNDIQNETSEINDNEDFCERECGNEIYKISSTDGENCHPQHIKYNDSYIQSSNFDLHANVFSTSGLERCNSLFSGNSSNQLLDSSQAIKVPLSREITHEVGDPSLIENSVPKGLSHDTRGYVFDRLDAIGPRELSRDPVETSDPRRLSPDTNGYVPHPVEASVP